MLWGEPKDVSGFNEVPLGDTYEWNIIPYPSDGFLQQLVIGVCGDHLNVTPPQGTQRTIQRNTTILQNGSTSACFRSDYDGQYPFASAGSTLGTLASGALELIGAVLPDPLYASLVGRGGGGVAGQVNNFSDFTPVGANLNAELVFVASPGDASFGGQDEATLDQVKVLARTVSGTPIEFIEVTLASVDNNGSKVMLSGDATQVTGEVGGIATFDNLTLNKTGGYRLCATAGPSSFNFEGTFCSERFNVKPN